MQAPDPQPPSFKVLLVGDVGTGKTTLVRRLLSGEFERKYLPTLGVEVHPLQFHTTHGKMILHCWDTAGQGVLRDGYYVQAHAAIILFDVTDRMSYQHVSMWYQDLQRAGEDIPIVICGNKVDLKDRKVKPKDITFHLEQGRHYFDISAKSNYNIEKPFLYICRRLAHDNKLAFTAEPTVLPPLAHVDMAVQSVYEAELRDLMAQGVRTPLPNEEDGER